MRITYLVLGVVLLSFGIFFLTSGGASINRRTNVAHSGSVQLSRETRSYFSLPPAGSLLAIAAGVGLVVAGLRSR